MQDSGPELLLEQFSVRLQEFANHRDESLRKIARLEQTCDRLTRQRDATQLEVDRVAKRIPELERRVTDAENRAAAASSAPAAAPSSKSDPNEVVRLRADLKRCTTNYTNAMSQITAYKKEIDVAENAREELQRDLRDADRKGNAALAREKQLHLDKSKDLDRQRNLWQNERTKLAAELKEELSKHEAARRKFDESSTAQSKRIEELEEESAGNKDLKDKLAKAEDGRKENGQRLKAFKGKWDTAGTEIARLGLNCTVWDLPSLVGSAREENARLASTVQVTEKERSDLRKSLAHLEKVSNEMQLKLDDEVRQSKQLRDMLGATYKSGPNVADAGANLAEENATLRRQLEQTRTDLVGQQAVVQTLHQEKLDLEGKLAAAGGGAGAASGEETEGTMPFGVWYDLWAPLEVTTEILSIDAGGHDADIAEELGVDVATLDFDSTNVQGDVAPRHLVLRLQKLLGQISESVS